MSCGERLYLIASMLRQKSRESVEARLNVPKLPQSRVELLPVDGTGPITVEMTENILPILDIFPETCELISRSQTKFQTPR